MTATTPNHGSQVPWRVRWTVYALAAFAVLAIPGTTRDVGLRFIHNVAHIAGINDEGPIELSPTNPPDVTP